MQLKIRTLAVPTLARSLALALALALFVPATVTAQSIELLAPAAGDLVVRELLPTAQLKTVLPPSAPGVEREPLSFAWPLDPEAELTRSAPFVAESREYWFQVDGRQLAAGVRLPVAAPAAVVRINPQPGRAAGSAARTLSASELRLVDPRGDLHRAGTGMEQLATAEQLRAAGAPFAEGTVAFRIAAPLGAGEFVLRVADGAAAPRDRYVIHVFDRGSDAVLRLTTGQGAYLHGDRLTVAAALTDSGRHVELDAVTAFVTSPAGRGWPVTLRPDGAGTYRGTLALDGSGEATARGEGLWEVLLSAHGESDGQAIVRGARTAFTAAAPTARLLGAAGAVVEARGSVAVRFEVEAAVAGRYEVRGVLHGTATDGRLHPVAVGHAAAWIEAGPGSLTLAFGPEVTRGSGLSAPYEIRDLRLMDQGRMGLLHQQQRGVIVTP